MIHRNFDEFGNLYSTLDEETGGGSHQYLTKVPIYFNGFVLDDEPNLFWPAPAGTTQPVAASSIPKHSENPRAAKRHKRGPRGASQKCRCP